MTDVVLRIVGRVDGVRTLVDGQFIVRYDPRFDRSGAYRLETSFDINAAISFATVEAATEYIRRPSPNRPYDSPGHVNRPITCYHIEILRQKMS